MLRHLMKSRVYEPLRWFSSAAFDSDRRKARPRRKTRRDALACETLEGRVVLTGFDTTNLLAGLSYVGVVTSPIVVPTQPFQPVFPSMPASRSSAVTQLNSDVKALLTELQTLASKSGVTLSDLQSLGSDSQSISQAGFQFSASSLNPVLSELATAVAGGTSTTQAQSDWRALFGGSSVSSAVINSTFSDLVTAITDSQVTTTDLTTVANDEAAIQSEISSDGLDGLGPMAADVGTIEDYLSVGVLQSVAIGESPIVSVISVPPYFPAPLPASLLLTGVPIPGQAPVPPPTILPTPTFPPIPYIGSGLLGAVNDTGIVTSTVFTVTPPSSSGTTTGPVAQLNADEQALQTELQSLAAKSGLTVADLESLTVDDQSIQQAEFFLSGQELNPVLTELATAVAGGTSTTQAQTDFTALFSGSKVPSSLITSTFNDLVKAIQDSHVTTTDLATVANDESAIQSDLSNLNYGGDSGSTGSGSTGPANTGSGSTGSGTTGSGSKVDSESKPLIQSPANTLAGTTSGSTGSGTPGTDSGTTGKHGHHSKAHALAHAQAHHSAVKIARVAVKSDRKRK
jgi:hypothetical protein